MAPPPLPRPTIPRGWVRLLVGGFVRAGLMTYFRRIEVFHDERVPRTGPLLIVANHPGSVTDAFLIGAVVPRIVHFVATVRLFRLRAMAFVLRRCGIVPINRRQDDPTAMGTVAETFEHCFRVLEDGGAVGIFPEGVSYNDDQLRPVKTGAGRMALEIEDRHAGALDLHIQPVGITYAAKGRYRTDVLVNFGGPFRATGWLEAYRRDRHGAVRSLSAAIEDRIRELILSLPTLDHQRIVASVKRLYLDRLRASNRLITESVPPRAEELLLGQAIAGALAHFESAAPDRLAGFVNDLIRYEQRLHTLGLSDRSVGALADDDDVPVPGLLATAGLVAGAPFALFGWVHRIAPVWLIEWAVDRFSPPDNRRAQVAHASILAGFIGFGMLYALAAGLMWYVAGWPLALVYLVSLPVTGVFAHHYARFLRRYAGRVRAMRILMRLPLTRRNLARTRARLIREIEAFREDYRRDVLRMPEVES